MRYAWNGIGMLLVGVGIVTATGGSARAQTCAPHEARCPSGACCSAPGVCCPTAIGGGCCSDGTPYCCGDGTCAVAASDCPGASSTGRDAGCAGYDIPCGAGCIPAGADCCDATHYCPPATVCAASTTTMCTDGTTSPLTDAYPVLRGTGGEPSPSASASSPLGDPPDATARSCSTSDGRPSPLSPMYIAVGALALIRLRRRGTLRTRCPHGSWLRPLRSLESEAGRRFAVHRSGRLTPCGPNTTDSSPGGI